MSKAATVFGAREIEISPYYGQKRSFFRHIDFDGLVI
jgi:hypothetical protein